MYKIAIIWHGTYSKVSSESSNSVSDSPTNARMNVGKSIEQHTRPYNIVSVSILVR
jgi:hypothetical protein